MRATTDLFGSGPIHLHYGRRRRTPAPSRSDAAQRFNKRGLVPGSPKLYRWRLASVRGSVLARSAPPPTSRPAATSTPKSVKQGTAPRHGTWKGAQEDSRRTARSLSAANLAFLRFSTIIFCTRIALHTTPPTPVLSLHSIANNCRQRGEWMGRARVDVAWREWLLAVNHRLGHPCVHRRAALLDRLINLTRRRLLRSSTYIPLLSASRTRQAQALMGVGGP